MTRASGTPERKTKSAAKGQATPVGKYLVIDPDVCHGEMTFRGTRVPVETILLYLAKGRSREYIRKSWPEVSAEAIAEALRLATELFIQHHREKQS